jgi:hypothetical protein
MKGSVDFSDVHYAVIRVCPSQDPPELLVITYTDEKSLRELIAPPSILGLGFDSRVAAVRSARADLAANQTPERIVMIDRDRTRQREVHSETQGLTSRLRILQQALVIAVLIFYSGNIVSAMIRTTLGFPC